MQDLSDTSLSNQAARTQLSSARSIGYLLDHNSPRQADNFQYNVHDMRFVTNFAARTSYAAVIVLGVKEGSRLIPSDALTGLARG